CVYSQYKSLETISTLLATSIRNNSWNEKSNSDDYYVSGIDQQCNKGSKEKPKYKYSYKFQIIISAEHFDNNDPKKPNYIYVHHEKEKGKYYFKGQPIGKISDKNNINTYVEFLGTKTAKAYTMRADDIDLLIADLKKKIEAYKQKSEQLRMQATRVERRMRNTE
ncbi:MAG: hypothetical protein KDD52_09430, partial [Bdellovibrionales bacterium]|nr:hypothetical protein [Bdellovibrionales bacterium]